jgi:putative DNA methylase
LTTLRRTAGASRYERVLSKVDEKRFKSRTISAKGQAFICLLTGSAVDRDYIQVEGKADRLEVRLMAVVAEGHRSRAYVSPKAVHEQVAGSADNNPMTTDDDD